MAKQKNKKKSTTKKSKKKTSKKTKAESKFKFAVEDINMKSKIDTAKVEPKPKIVKSEPKPVPKIAPVKTWVYKYKIRGYKLRRLLVRENLSLNQLITEDDFVEVLKRRYGIIKGGN